MTDLPGPIVFDLPIPPFPNKVPLRSSGVFDLDAVDAAIEADPAVRLLHVQRSCGYRWRPSIPIAEIERYYNVVSVLLLESSKGPRP